MVRQIPQGGLAKTANLLGVWVKYRVSTHDSPYLRLRLDCLKKRIRGYKNGEFCLHFQCDDFRNISIGRELTEPSPKVRKEIRGAEALLPPCAISLCKVHMMKWSVGLCSPADNHANGPYETSVNDTPLLLYGDTQNLDTRGNRDFSAVFPSIGLGRIIAIGYSMEQNALGKSRGRSSISLTTAFSPRVRESAQIPI